jgi:hypothetical protein
MLVAVLLDMFFSKEAVHLFQPAQTDKLSAQAPTHVFVLLEPTGMEFHALHATMAKFGVPQHIPVFVHKDLTGMAIHASPVNLDKYGVLHLIVALAPLDKTGMDSHVLLVMVEGHGAAL